MITDVDVQAVLFDLDGVLVDACEWHYEALNLALLEYGFPIISRGDHISKYNGLPTSKKLSIMGVTASVHAEINSRKQALTKEIIERKSCPRPEKVELLKYLKTNHIKTACVTNSIKDTAVQMLKSCGVLPYIDAVISNQDVRQPKPQPDGYDLAVKVLGVNGYESICVEDSPVGIQAAKSSIVSHVWEISRIEEVCLSEFREYVNANFDSDGGRRQQI